jgi:hypothetical protein
LLPKEAFVLQLVRECCGTAKQPKAEKVVVFSQVGQSPRWGGGELVWVLWDGKAVQG